MTGLKNTAISSFKKAIHSLPICTALFITFILCGYALTQVVDVGANIFPQFSNIPLQHKNDATASLDPEAEHFEIVESYMVENKCYKRARKIEVKGLILHSIGTPQPNAQPIITNYNKATKCIAFHAVISGNTVYQTLPWDYWAGHCGSGKNGSGNASYIGVEMTEPKEIEYINPYTVKVLDFDAALEFEKQNYHTAVKLFAELCKRFNLDPLEDGVILSHTEAHERGIASNHGDPEHLWSHLGLTMDAFRQDVYKQMED